MHKYLINIQEASSGWGDYNSNNSRRIGNTSMLEPLLLTPARSGSQATGHVKDCLFNLSSRIVSSVDRDLPKVCAKRVYVDGEEYPSENFLCLFVTRTIATSV